VLIHGRPVSFAGDASLLKVFVKALENTGKGGDVLRDSCAFEKVHLDNGYRVLMTNDMYLMRKITGGGSTRCVRG
jgi:hypothetical protein